MKVGTLTFHKVNNFGAVLQAYALQKYLLQLNYNAEIIDFSPNQQINNLKASKFDKVIKYLTSPKKQIDARITNKKFREFRDENLKLSKQTFIGDDSLEISNLNYDAYIVGSDQIWNTDLSNKAKAFYLHFVNAGRKKISYAASFGKNTFNEVEKKYITEYLQTFNSLSVREKQHADLLFNMFNINALVTLDPVFLIRQSEWEKLIKPIRRKPKKYVLVYLLEYSEELFECANKKAKELNCDILYISLMKEKINGRVLTGIGPSEFLDAFSNASYVCTNSFHGTAFSIIFKKNFSVVKHTTRNSRIDNILEISGLKERYYKRGKSNEQNIDYSQVMKRLIDPIYQSKKFIESSLEIE